MRRLVVVLLAAAIAASLSVSVFAATWQLVGTSGFTTTGTWFQDHDRIRFGTVAVDALGNVYVACTNGNNAGTANGGITIFKTNGTKIDINLTTATAFVPGPPATTTTVQGGVTKLITGPDGMVYALQNWREINWNYGQANVPNRILQVASDGSLVQVWGYTTWADGDRISGIASDGSGYIYWTLNGADNYGKNHYLWRYDVAAGTIEEATPLGYNQGHNEANKMFGLEYAGDDTLAVIASGGADWALDPMKWTVLRPELKQNQILGTWGRDHVTAYAYDPLRKKMWVGGRGTAGTNPWYSVGAGDVPSNPAAGNGKFLVDLGSGNKGVTCIRNAAGSTEDSGFQRHPGRTPIVPEVTLAARFRVDSYVNFTGAYLWLQCDSTGLGGSPTPRMAIRVNAGRFKLYNIATATDVADLGALDTSFHDAYLYVNANTGLVRCWWDNLSKFNATVGMVGDSGTYANVGVGYSFPGLTSTGNTQMTIDWVGYAESLVAPGDAWPSNLIASFCDGSCYPSNFVSSCVMSRWNGDAASAGMFNGEDVSSWDSWHANGNDVLASNTSNNGIYWVSALEVNPNDGAAWMAYGGTKYYRRGQVQQEYTGSTNGEVFVRSLSLGYSSEGIPEAGAQVIGLKYKSGKMYAATVNVTTGAFNLYSATLDTTYGAAPISQAKQGPVGRLYQTNTPKLVTWPAASDVPYKTFFYIQDADRAGAIKVIPTAGQPVAGVGQKVSVTGYLDVKDGEAVCYASSVTVSATAEKAKPLAITGSKVGGLALGIQPATLLGGSSSYGLPSWLNTTARLITVAGTMVNNGLDQFVDDGTPFPVRIEDYDTGVSTGTHVAITGISGVVWDGANGFRVILPRDDNDIVTY